MIAGADVGFGLADLYRGSVEGAAYVFALEALQVGAGLLCLGLYQKWGERLPGWVPVVGGRSIPRKIPLIVGTVGNILLYIIVYSVAALFPIALLQQPPAWTPAEGMNTTQAFIMSLCYTPMLIWPIALTVALIGYRRRH